MSITLEINQFELQFRQCLKTWKFENWALSFISMIRPAVRTNSSRKRSFSKTLFKPEEFETGASFSFSYE